MVRRSAPSRNYSRRNQWCVTANGKRQPKYECKNYCRARIPSKSIVAAISLYYDGTQKIINKNLWHVLSRTPTSWSVTGGWRRVRTTRWCGERPPINVRYNVNGCRLWRTGKIREKLIQTLASTLQDFKYTCLNRYNRLRVPFVWRWQSYINLLRVEALGGYYDCMLR